MIEKINFQNKEYDVVAIDYQRIPVGAIVINGIGEVGICILGAEMFFAENPSFVFIDNNNISKSFLSLGKNSSQCPISMIANPKDLISFVLNNVFNHEIERYTSFGKVVREIMNVYGENNVGTNNLPRCELCESYGYIHTDIGLLCDRCFEERNSFCPMCEDSYMRPVNWTDELCPHCAPRRLILPYHRFSPEIDFFGDNKNNSVPFLGIEIEVDEGGQSDRHAREVIDMFNNEDRFVWCSRDGSLSNGFEVITMPATLEYHREIKPTYKKAFKYLLDNRYAAHDTDTCGIHIHFNRDFFEDNEEASIARLLYIVDKFWDDIVHFSRRNQKKIDRYAKKVDMTTNDYIKWANKNREDREPHYYAINLQNKDTIEFRMYKGTLNINTLMAIIQITHNIIMCAKNKTSEEIQHMEFDDFITHTECIAYWNRRNAIPNNEE